MRDLLPNKHIQAALVTLCLFLVSGCSNLATTAPEGRDLSGDWVLNHEQSDPLPAIRPSRGRGAARHDGRSRQGRSAIS